MQYSYFLSQKLLKVLIIGLIIAFASIIYAQEELGEESSPYDVTFQRPIVSEAEERQLTLLFTAQNNAENPVSLHFGATLYEVGEGSRILVDVAKGGMTKLDSGSSEQLTFMYEVPGWIDGNHELRVALYADDGTVLGDELVNEIQFITEQSLGVEIIRESCLFILDEGSKTTIDSAIILQEHQPATVECDVVNHTETEFTATPRISLLNPQLVGSTVEEIEQEPITLAPQNVTPITFTIPKVSNNGSYSVALDLGGEFVSNKIFTEMFEYVAPEPITNTQHTATKTEQDTVVYVVSLLLSLLILLAILVYRRRTTLPTTTTHNPE